LYLRSALALGASVADVEALCYLLSPAKVIAISRHLHMISHVHASDVEALCYLLSPAKVTQMY
jgi:hypothetical protein